MSLRVLKPLSVLKKIRTNLGDGLPWRISKPSFTTRWFVAGAVVGAASCLDGGNSALVIGF